MYQILAKDRDEIDYAVVDYCDEKDLENALSYWKSMYEFVTAERV